MPNGNVYCFFMQQQETEPTATATEAATVLCEIWKLCWACKLLSSPEHLNSWSCKSATFCPFNWLGEWQRVYGANRGALRRNFESHDRWQSHANGLSDKRKALSRGMLENISRGIVVMLLLLSVSISNSCRFFTAISSMHTIWLWSSWRLRSAGTPLNIRFDIAAISLFDKSLKKKKERKKAKWNETWKKLEWEIKVQLYLHPDQVGHASQKIIGKCFNFIVV